MALVDGTTIAFGAHGKHDRPGCLIHRCLNFLVTRNEHVQYLLEAEIKRQRDCCMAKSSKPL